MGPNHQVFPVIDVVSNSRNARYVVGVSIVTHVTDAKIVSADLGASCGGNALSVNLTFSYCFFTSPDN